MKKKKASKKKKAKKATRKAKKKDLRELAYPQHLSENRVIEELRQTVEKLTIFDSIGKTLTSQVDLSEILRLVVEKFGSIVQCKHMGLVLLDRISNEFYYQFPSSTGRTKRTYPIGQGLIGQCLERARGGLKVNPQKDPHFDSEVDAFVLQNPGSMIHIPILSKGSVLGALVFLKEPDEAPFLSRDLQSVETFSDYLAIAVENATNFQKIQDLTITDDLTQLYNSRYLSVILEREIARSRRYKEELSLVFLDLDNFKSINDTHGHMMGSTLLTEFGNFLYHQIRTSDIGIRYGGDEFVLVLPKTSKSEAVRVVERMIEDLRGHIFLKSKNMNIQITASFGIASFPEDGDSIDDIIASADRAMYEVKRSSKNGVFATNLRANFKS